MERRKANMVVEQPGQRVTYESHYRCHGVGPLCNITKNKKGRNMKSSLYAEEYYLVMIFILTRRECSRDRALVPS